MTEQMTSERVDTNEQRRHVNGIDMETLGGTVRAIEDEPELGKCRFRPLTDGRVVPATER